jgi:type IV pilus assembly protein PilY1
MTPTSGVFRVNYEDVEQGADHDMDAIARYQYQVVNGNQLSITVTSEYAAGGIIQHMGYVISGTTQDGTYLVVRDADTAANQDPDYFLDTPVGQPPGGNWQDNVELPLGPVVRTFTVGSTNGAGYLKDPLWYAAKWGGFDENDPATADNLPDRPEKWDADHDGVPDNYFLVTNASTLKDQLGKAFASADKDAGSASSAAVSSGSISDDTKVYQALFQAKTWSGHLYASPISNGDSNHDGVIDANDVAEGKLLGQVWDAAEEIPAPGTRRIATPTSTRTNAGGGTLLYKSAVPFEWASLDATLQGNLQVAPEVASTNAQARLGWLRGVTTDELPGGLFRTRTTFTSQPTVKNVLGDIVNSAPTFVGAPRARYRDNLETQPYSAFKAAYVNRAPTLYVGANDGMLHAFDGNTGAERFAFIPRSVFQNLPALTDPNYTHKYYVDGTPSVTDAFVNNQWRTVLASGLNKGGQGIFTLDVTNPASLTTEANVASAFMWEFTDETDPDLGYTYARPTIARLHNGKWAAIFGNGYNNTDTRGGADTHVSTTGNAVLYVVDLETGALIKKIDTGVGTSADPVGASHPNGLSTPAVADLDADSVADFVYAGDMFGNLWKFDIRSANPSDWDQNANMKVLFHATNGTQSQPITEKPQVDIGPKGLGMIVLFGTGKFLEASDRDPSQSITQSFYGIYDSNQAGAPAVTRANLIQQTIVGETSATFNGSQVSARITSNNPVTTGKKGWYIDLGTTSGSQGEMQVTDPVLRNGRVLFTTLIPDTDPCAYGGRSWLMELDEYSGSRLSYSPFDFNNDKSFNASDFVTMTVNGNSVQLPASGFSRDSIMSRAAVIAGQAGDYAIMTDTSGGGQDPTRLNPGPGAIGRQSWRQLR